MDLSPEQKQAGAELARAFVAYTQADRRQGALRTPEAFAAFHAAGARLAEAKAALRDATPYPDGVTTPERQNYRNR